MNNIATTEQSDRKPTMDEMIAGFVRFAQEHGIDSVLVLICSPASTEGIFEHSAQVKGDGRKILPSLAKLIRATCDEDVIANFVALLLHGEMSSSEDPKPKWVN